MDGESLNGRPAPGPAGDEAAPAGRFGPGHLPGDRPLDDVDRLFSRLDPLPAPRSFVVDVLRAVRPTETVVAVAQPGVRQLAGALAWAAAAVASLLAVTVLAFLATQAFVVGGALDVLALTIGDADVAADFRGATFLAFVEAFPWLELFGLLGALALLSYASRRLSQGLAGGQDGGRRPGDAGPSGAIGTEGIRGVGGAA